jgi:hypothetical protein
MTPARRRKLIRNICILIGIMVLIGGSQFYFFGLNIPALLLNRKAGTFPSGTPLLHEWKGGNDVGAPITETSLPPEAADRVKIDFKKLGSWKYKEGKTPIPDELKKLDGKWIELTGYVYSSNQPQFLENFIVVQSLWDCCFGKSPDMNHFVDVKLPPGKIAMDYSEPVILIGKFSVGELREEDGRGGSYLLSLYRLEVHMIKVK